MLLMLANLTWADDNDDEVVIELEDGGEIEARSDAEADHLDASGSPLMAADQVDGVLTVGTVGGEFASTFLPYAPPQSSLELAEWLERFELGTATLDDLGIPEPTFDEASPAGPAIAAAAAAPVYYRIDFGTLGYAATSTDAWTVSCPAGTTKVVGDVLDMNTIFNSYAAVTLRWGKAGKPTKACTDTESTSTSGCWPTGSVYVSQGSGTYNVTLTKTGLYPEDYAVLIECRNAADQVIGPTSPPWTRTSNQ